MTFNNLCAQTRIRLCIAAFGMAVAISGVLYCLLPPTPAEDADALPIIESGLPAELVLLGKIEPYRIVSLYAPFEGTVQSLAVQNGDRVSAGANLLTLDTRSLDLQLREALADKLRAQKSVQTLIDWEKSPEMLAAQRHISQLERALGHIRRQENESRKLYLQGIIPRQELDELTLQKKALETELREAREDRHRLSAQAQGEEREIAEMALQNAAEKYDDLLALRAKKTLIAPFNGTVTFTDIRQRSAADTPPAIEVGAPVSLRQPLLQLAASERFKITSTVSEYDLHRLQTGQPVTITGDGLNQHTLYGRVSHIAQHAEPADDASEPANFAVTVVIDAPAPEAGAYIRPGMSVMLAIAA